jgi:hypothetical protein
MIATAKEAGEYWHLHHYDRRNTSIYAHMNSRTLVTCDINLGSLALHASEAGDFVELSSCNLTGSGLVIALASSPHGHDPSVSELLIQTSHDDMAEMKEVLCYSGRHLTCSERKTAYKAGSSCCKNKFGVNITFQNMLRFMNISYVVSVGKQRRKMHIHIRCV